MKFDTRALGYGVGLSTAIAWILCSILVALTPSASMTVTRDMFHLVGNEIQWGLTWKGFLVGLISWTLCAGLFAVLCGALVNRFSRGADEKKVSR